MAISRACVHAILGVLTSYGGEELEKRGGGIAFNVGFHGVAQPGFRVNKCKNPSGHQTWFLSLRLSNMG